MPTANPGAIKLQVAKYTASTKAVGARQHLDLQELRMATKYVGRNIQTLNEDLNTGLDAITIQEERIAGELTQIGDSLDRLVEVTKDGFLMTAILLNRISNQLNQVLHILRYPGETRGSELREKGIYLTGKGRPQLAVEILQEAIKLNPRDYISYYSLGYIFSNSEQFDAAAAAYDECALHADDNPAIAVDAAILAASSYQKIGKQKAAWGVLERSLSFNCPDLALALMKYAHSESEMEFAVKQLADAFVTDAELVLTAQKMGLPFVKEASALAYDQFTSEITRLKRTWKQIADMGGTAGAYSPKRLPEPPKLNGTPQVKAMNAAIYRRTLQFGISKMKERLELRLSDPLEEPEAPRSAYFESYGIEWRVIGASIFGLIGWGLLRTGEPHPGYVCFIIVGLIMATDIFLFFRWIVQTIQYAPENREYDEQATRIRRANARLNHYRDEVRSEVKAAESVLSETIPPKVPRAFSDDYISFSRN